MDNVDLVNSKVLTCDKLAEHVKSWSIWSPKLSCRNTQCGLFYNTTFSMWIMLSFINNRCVGLIIVRSSRIIVPHLLEE